MGFLSNLFRMPSFDGVTNALLMELMSPHSLLVPSRSSSTRGRRPSTNLSPPLVLHSLPDPRLWRRCPDLLGPVRG